jgi:hypothetical protein
VEALKPVLISVIRTVIMPLAAGGLLQLLFLAGVADPSIEVQAALASIIAITWYLLARYLETLNPLWGLMLLVAVQPNYDDGTSDRLILGVKRTVVPLLVGWAVTALAAAGFDLPQDTLIVGLQALITTAYYGVIRIIEERQGPTKASALIGGKALPLY